MSDFSPIGPGVNGSIGPVNRLHAASLNLVNGSPSRLHEAVQDRSIADDSDRVELSDFARYLDKLRQLPEIRQDLVSQVRQAIDAGTYETDDKINMAIDRLAEEGLA